MPAEAILSPITLQLVSPFTLYVIFLPSPNVYLQKTARREETPCHLLPGLLYRGLYHLALIHAINMY